jgi:hypothetical protein
VKKGGSKSKGNAFERECCKELSLWWSCGKEEDDIFYRSDSSGGRATVRSKNKKTTVGQYGDVSLRKNIGQPLLSLCTIELKTGYPGQTPFDLVDGQSKHKPTYGKFFEQSFREKKEAKTPYWMLIARRMGKVKMVYIPFTLYTRLSRPKPSWIDGQLDEAFPSARLSVKVGKKRVKIFGTPLSEFLRLVKPVDIQMVLESLGK